MRALVSRIAKRWILRLQRDREVARFEGIILADFHVSGWRARLRLGASSRIAERRTPHFREIILASLELLKRSEPRLFARVKRHIAWIVNTTLSHGGAEYDYGIRTCSIDFQEPGPQFDSPYLIAWYACTLVHEATHGVIRARGIRYSAELRDRIERLCVLEEQRFVRRLSAEDPALAARIPCEFNASDWHGRWSATRFECFRLSIARLFHRE